MTPLSARARGLLVVFGLLLGTLIAAGGGLLLRPPACSPSTDGMAATSAVEMFKRPCDVFTWDLEEPGIPSHTVRYNSFGMHDDPVTLEKPPNTFRILMIGDSYTQGLQVPMERGYPDLLETRLNDQTEGGQRYEVVNLSIDTLGTGRLLLLYALLGHRFDADLVLLATYVGNDVQNNSIELEKLRNEGYRPHAFFKLDAGGNLRLHDWDEEKHGLPQGDDPAPAWMRRAITAQPYPIITPEAPRVLNQQPYQLEYPVQLGLYLPEDDDWAEAWAISDAVLGQFAALAERQGSAFGVIVIPDRRAVHQADRARTRELYPFVGDFDAAAPQARMVALSEAHGIPTLDLLPVLLRAEAAGERAYLPLDGHYNALGHALTAGAVADWLAETDLVPQ